MSNITVIGAGYVGLVTASCFASLGHNVRCVEPDERRLAKIAAGKMPIFEPGLDQIVQEATASGRLKFVSSIAESLEETGFAFMAVPTPPLADGSSDLSAITSVAGQLSELAEDGTIIVIKSTVPVGTGDRVAEMVGTRLPVVNNPEFLREGTAVDDFLNPDRLVVGADDSDAALSVAELYRDVKAEVITTDRRSAELAKYASNAYLAVRLSFVNEIARISQATGADIDSVTRVLSSDHRIGPHYLRTGIGWGGSCLPKDVASLEHSGRQGGVEPHMLVAAKAANNAQVDYLVDVLESALDELDGRVIALLGTAFKAGTDDVRESPAIVAGKRLVELGAEVRFHDSLALENTLVAAPEFKPAANVEKLTAGADAVILCVDSPEYGEIDWSAAASGMRGRVVFDARNALDAGAVRRAGLHYASYGRGKQVR